MIEIQTILCPVDLSDCSKQALDQAIAIARWCEAAEVLAGGRPAQAILDTAASRDIDLVVMGVGTRQAAGVLLLGSTAAKVIRQATCPVMTTRD